MHQPHYLPWLGYFHKIDRCDYFVFLDCVQFEKGGFQNRNKIRTSDGARWLTVPVLTKGAPQQKLNEVVIDTTRYWQKSHWGLLKASYKNSPFFQEHACFFLNVYTRPWERLVDLNIAITRYILEYLGIKKEILIESDLKIASAATQRIVDICKRLGADTYFSGAGASSYLEEERFKENNVSVVYQRFIHPEYRQAFDPFLPFMSIIDLLFNHGKESITFLRSSP